MTTDSSPGSGISRDLANRRRRVIHDPGYTLQLSLPREPMTPLRGRVVIEFALDADAWPAIDFAPFGDDDRSAAAVTDVTVAGDPVPYRLREGHIVIEGPTTAAARQRIEIGFTASHDALVRRDDLVCTLFVPARAHTLFPCFDQPDIKARLALELDLPAAWTAIANARAVESRLSGDRRLVRFAETGPLPTYLFAFAAGRLRELARTVDGRELRMLCPVASEPPDDDLDEIFRLHADALDFLEDYTGIAYPFAQFGFVLVPDFDFAGMEHPGAILYRENLLLIPAEAGQAAEVRRANLIAHETAHMWFGNLVTMGWFDDVWLKEVFANFMADKIVARSFPHADHPLRFALHHLPHAYAIDRSEGSHAIRESLDNLSEAGELYDALIYHKAPVAMAELEARIGEDSMRRGLRRYLHDYRFANAGWDDLRERLQRETQADLEAFSRQWIESAGWPREVECPFGSESIRYGDRVSDAAMRERLLLGLTGDRSPLQRALAWITLYEDMLDGGIAPAALLAGACKLLERETELLLATRVIDDLAEIYWRFLGAARRERAAGPVERVFWLRYHGAGDGALFWLDALTRFATTPRTRAGIESIWRGETPESLRLPEALATRIALTLSMHEPERAGHVIEEQLGRITEADRRARLEFLRPALDPDRATRDRFFARLIAGADRGLWVVEGARWLNHALRARDAVHYLEPGLGFAADIRRRGDIFLPRQWLGALFGGHGSEAAARAIRSFLDSDGLPERFRRLVLQTADPVFRASRIRG